MFGDEPRPEWMTSAGCQGYPVAWWYAEPHQVVERRRAQAICEGCQVRAVCAGYAIEQGQRYGTWGGLSERQRAKLRRLPLAA